MKNKFLKEYKFFLWIFLPLFALLLTADLLTKHFTNVYLAVGETVSFLPGFIQLTNVHNTGAAWNMFAGQQYFLIALTVLMIGLLTFLYVSEKNKTPLFNVAFSLVLCGAVGNLIDRIAFSYVRDMIHLEFWKSFPVFNVADICVCVGIALVFVFYIIHLVKEFKSRKKNAN